VSFNSLEAPTPSEHRLSKRHQSLVRAPTFYGSWSLSSTNLIAIHTIYFLPNLIQITQCSFSQIWSKICTTSFLKTDYNYAYSLPSNLIKTCPLSLHRLLSYIFSNSSFFYISILFSQTCHKLFYKSAINSLTNLPLFLFQFLILYHTYIFLI